MGVANKTADLIFERVQGLPETLALEVLDFVEFLQSRLERQANEWDAQIAADATAGKLDFLLQQALDAEQQGQLREL